MSRPRIICHMVASLDGRLLTERWNGLPQEALDLYEEIADRLDADGWIVGRTTMSSFVPAGDENLEPAFDPAIKPLDHVGTPAGRSLAICFDRKGKLKPQTDDVEGSHLVLILSDRVSRSHVAELVAKGVSVLFAGPDGNDIAGAIGRLKDAFKVSALLLEGGGVLNGAFLEQGMIDETSTLVMPVLDGESGIPSIYDHEGKLRGKSLKLLDVETLAYDAVWMHHQIKPD
ncbi:dihydrofolate reductase family protein [Cohaesibacter haloalkalitolerans]|uniref:dihydrofolate reductase family protein n=1 Tax=Cohaesibacter haloalkalitolerans TaxID=1162980 RepID=UPI000E65DBA2|nr:dihydrofolate reductase family protein [Cohaesibacter haloalkalitolerans]